jgi:hypothetical protein
VNFLYANAEKNKMIAGETALVHEKEIDAQRINV